MVKKKEIKEGGRKRQKTSRERLKNSGGRSLEVRLDKEANVRFEILRIIYRDMTIGKLIGFALKILDEQTKKTLAKK